MIIRVAPIQNGSAPFFGSFDPQMPLSAFEGLDAKGTWTLVITNATTGSGSVGTFNSWSLSFQKPLPTSGLGENGSDNVTESFRIFTLSQTDGLSSEQWTSVGPAPITGSTGQVSAIAVDPSDTSGNTVYVAGASGGIWKTTDFLTTDPDGPTYVPLTNFGLTSGINVSSIAVFRAQQRSQSIDCHRRNWKHNRGRRPYGSFGRRVLVFIGRWLDLEPARQHG